MREREFTPAERALLESNVNVLKVGNSNIIYTKEFKRHAINLCNEGVSVNNIFHDAGIDLSIFPHNYAKYTLKRWRKTQGSHKEQQVPKRRGRQKDVSNMTREEMEAKIAYLEAENDFLKKLQALELGE